MLSFHVLLFVYNYNGVEREGYVHAYTVHDRTGAMVSRYGWLVLGLADWASLYCIDGWRSFESGVREDLWLWGAAERSIVSVVATMNIIKNNS